MTSDQRAGKRWIAVVLIGVLTAGCSTSVSYHREEKACVEHNVNRMFGVAYDKFDSTMDHPERYCR